MPKSRVAREVDEILAKGNVRSVEDRHSTKSLGRKLGSIGNVNVHGPLNVKFARLITTCHPHNLRAGDMLHVREDGVLSTVTGHHKGRAGTEVIEFRDHPSITVAGEAELAVFGP